MTKGNEFESVFQIKDDKLVFLKDKSASVTLIDLMSGIQITDESVFKLRKIIALFQQLFSNIILI